MLRTDQTNTEHAQEEQVDQTPPPPPADAAPGGAEAAAAPAEGPGAADRPEPDVPVQSEERSAPDETGAESPEPDGQDIACSEGVQHPLQDGPAVNHAREPDPAEADSTTRALNEIDQALASEVDDLLGGGSESVDQLLEGAFEDDALAGPRPEAESTGGTEPLGRGAAGSAAPGGAAGGADEIQEGEQQRAGDKPGQYLPDRDAPAAFQGTVRLAEPAPAAGAAPVAVDEQSAPEAADAAAPAASARAKEPEPAAATAVEPALTPQQEEPSPPPQPAPSFVQRVLSIASMLRRRAAVAAMITLALLSLPLRLVPDSFRPIVDWFAISLVFWVPIVWVLAIILTR